MYDTKLRSTKHLPEIGVAAILLVAAGFTPLTTRAAGEPPGACTRAAYAVFHACNHEVQEEYWTSHGNCINISPSEEKKDCHEESSEEAGEGIELCREQRTARLALCDSVGEDPYEPDFSPENFVDPLEIGDSVAPNPYFPLRPGTRWVYEKASLDDEEQEVIETITVVVTDKIKVIEGVSCLVVNDLVEEGGVPVEDTDDWYAQDLEGNVWYCGEIAENFETFEGDDPEEAELVDIEGSWKAGRDRAKPGILVKRQPAVGDVYRQEVFLGDAEDVAEVVEIDGTETTPAASCTNDCLVTREYTPIEPGIHEFKYYAPGIGLIFGTDMEGGREELVEYDPAD